MTVLQTIILAIVEGLTEFLPVSSTGHMIITQSLLGIPSDEFVKAFTVIIQFGAILSVAFLPAMVIGGLLNSVIDRLLGSVMVVAVMLVLGGVFMLFCDRLFDKGRENTVLTTRRALYIGLFQCIAMIPGVSRSMATIVGGMAQKLTRKDAAEFSFFLAVPTMFAATCLDVLKMVLRMHETGDTGVFIDHLGTLLLGSVVAFFVALLAIKGFVAFLTKYGFRAFGVYRIIVGGFIIVWLLLGHSLVMVD